MQDVRCTACGGASQFDPKGVWTSPGTLQGPQPGLPPTVVIQCPHCKQWIRVTLSDEGDKA